MRKFQDGDAVKIGTACFCVGRLSHFSGVEHYAIYQMSDELNRPTFEKAWGFGWIPCAVLDQLATKAVL